MFPVRVKHLFRTQAYKLLFHRTNRIALTSEVEQPAQIRRGRKAMQRAFRQKSSAKPNGNMIRIRLVLVPIEIDISITTQQKPRFGNMLTGDPTLSPSACESTLGTTKSCAPTLSFRSVA